MRPRIALALAALLGLVPSRSARADVFVIAPDPQNADECHTVTSRSAEEILGARVAPDASANTSPAISVRAGETLCVSYVALGDQLVSQRLVERGHMGPRMLRIRTVRHGQRTGIEISAGRDAVSLRIGSVLRDRPELIALLATQVEANRSQYETLDDPNAALLLYDLRIVAPPGDVPPPPRRWPGWIAVSLGAGLHFSELDALNDAFAKQGYSQVSPLQPLGALSLDVAFRRVHFALSLDGVGDRTFRHIASGRERSLSQVMVGLEGGYVLLAQRGLSLFAGLGINGGDIHFALDPKQPAIAPDQFGDVDKPEQVRRNRYTLRAQLGLDYLWPVFSANGGGLVFGARAGYTQQLGEETWVHEDAQLPSIHGGPKINVSGPFVRLLIGVYAGGF